MPVQGVNQSQSVVYQDGMGIPPPPPGPPPAGARRLNLTAIQTIKAVARQTPDSDNDGDTTDGEVEPHSPRTQALEEAYQAELQKQAKLEKLGNSAKKDFSTEMIESEDLGADLEVGLKSIELPSLKDTRAIYLLPALGFTLIGLGLFAGVHWGHISLDTAISVGTVGLLTAAGLAAIIFLKSMKERKTDWKALIGLIPLIAGIASYIIVNHLTGVNLLDKALNGFNPHTIGDWGVLIGGGIATFATTAALAALYNRRRMESELRDAGNGAAPGEDKPKADPIVTTNWMPEPPHVF